MDRVQCDLRDLDKLDIQKQGKPLVPPTPPRGKLAQSEIDILKQAFGLGARFDPSFGLFQEPIKVAQSPPKVVVKRPAKVPMASPRNDFTLAVGLNFEAFAVIGPVVQGGLYGSTLPELGVFVSFGGGWWTNIGAQVGPVITAVFGPPSLFEGIAIGIGCDVSFMAGSVGGLLLFTKPPFKFIGIAVGLSVGPSAIPAFDVTVQVTNTITKPLLK